MAPANPPVTHHFGAGQTWESQLICLFIILGFVLLYTLCCHLYTVVSKWSPQDPAANPEALDRLLGVPTPKNNERR
ncbi:hypothetical protein C8R44DRAFT_880639 [Mycena epipterygia]|nr:hypothetical protein C8R44DRAFT_880639 [Mycena epipterygia]